MVDGEKPTRFEWDLDDIVITEVDGKLVVTVPEVVTERTMTLVFADMPLRKPNLSLPEGEV